MRDKEREKAKMFLKYFFVFLLVVDDQIRCVDDYRAESELTGGVPASVASVGYAGGASSSMLSQYR